MGKLIREFLGHSKLGGLFKQEYREYYLGDVVEHSPRRYCQQCSYLKIESLHTHNPDGYDYRCNFCRLACSIMLSNSKEDM